MAYSYSSIYKMKNTGLRFFTLYGSYGRPDMAIFKFTNSIMKNNKINFIITDFKNELYVTFSGTVPNLFEEEKGVVAEGFLNDKKFLVADKILAKHDENYMPPEVKAALEEK